MTNIYSQELTAKVLTLAQDYFPIPEDAEDAVQEVLIKIGANMNKAPDGPDEFRAWAYRVAENKLRDLKRREKFIKALDAKATMTEDELIDRTDPLALLEQEEATILIIANYDKLPEELRDLLYARYYEELSYEQIAERFDIPIGTVGSRINRARNMITAYD